VRIEITRGKQRIRTTLGDLFAALRAVASSEAEAEAVFERMVSENRVRVIEAFARAA
jgi:hypothetical protein